MSRPDDHLTISICGHLIRLYKRRRITCTEELCVDVLKVKQDVVVLVGH